MYSIYISQLLDPSFNLLLRYLCENEINIMDIIVWLGEWSSC